jgi:hypothetical protein
VRADSDLACAGNLVINNARITSATAINLKADGSIMLNDSILEAPTINFSAGTTLSHNLGTIFDTTKSTLNSRVITRGTPNSYGIFSADVSVLNAGLEFKLVTLSEEQLRNLTYVPEITRIEAVYLPLPNTLALLISALAAVAASVYFRFPVAREKTAA